MSSDFIIVPSTPQDVLKEVTSLQQRAILVNNLVYKGRSLLQNAAYVGDYDICRALLRNGALPDQDLDRIPGTAAAATAANADPWGGSALHHATAALVGPPASSTSGSLGLRNRHRHAERLAATIYALLDGGADPCRENSAGLTALDLLLGLGPSGSSADRRPKKAAAAASDGGGCLSGLEALVRRSGRRCPYQVEVLRAMLSRSALGASMRCTEARIQVAPFRDTDWVTVWLMILRRRFCPSWTARPGAPLRLRPPPAHVASAATGEEEQLFELLGLSCDPGNGMALPRALLRLPLGPGCQLEGCCIGSSDGGGGGAVFTLANSKRLILPADGAMVRERLARNLPPEALSCAQPWSGLEEPQTALHVPAGGARLDGPCELLPSATAAATAVAVHFKLPVGAGTHQKAHFEALFSWMCSSGCGVLCKSNIEFWGGANASVGSAAAVLQVVPPPPQSDVPLVAGAYQGEGNRLAPGSEADSQLQSAAGLAAVVQVQDLEAPRRGLGPSLEVGIAANGELVEAALRGRATSVPQEHGTGGTNADRVPVGNHVEPPGDAEDVCLDPGTTSWAEPMEPPSHERGSMASGVLSSRNVRWDRAASVQIIEASVYEREAGVCPAPSPTQPSAAPSPSQLLSQHQRRQQQLQQEREPPLVSTRKAASARPGGTDNALCVVCLNASPVMGFRHGHTVHCCACYPCTQQLLEQRSEQTGQGRPSQPRGNVLCPLCRQTVEDVLLIYTP